ncbi:MAG: endonuclease III domain-containing protein [Desulfocapsaceae bacterium]|nr:endonuclease III domain-containing protein [Desulfocapsaceae bacterium]
MTEKNLFLEIYNRLNDFFGPQDWWPGETPLEVVVGAVLTQNTNWSNVCKAIENLKQSGLLFFEALLALPAADLAWQIRPSGYYTVKAGRLKNLLVMIEEKYQGELGLLLHDEMTTARANLLSVRGIGPETADSILLYGGNHPVFVVDAYTHRIFSRHNLLAEESDYDSIQEQFMGFLPADSALFNQYHALIVRLGKDFCKKNNPLCENCPLKGVEEG